MRVRLIVNPVASSMTERRRAAITDGLGGHHALETVETRGRGHARDLAAEAAAAGIDVVVVASGDGTLNEAADGLIGSTTALAPLPGGATNVFARAIGYGNRLDDATALLLAALDAESIRRIGVGTANGRHFLFHLGAGFDAAVVDRIERNPKVKRYAAHPAFALQTVRLLAHGYDRRVPAMHVEAPEARAPHDSFFTVVSNVAPYTYAGPRRLLLTPDASLDRALAVTSLTRFRLVDAVGAIGSSVGRAARLQRAEEIVQLSDVTEVSLTAPDPGRPFPWQVDGEPLGTVDALVVRYLPDALSVVLPA